MIITEPMTMITDYLMTVFLLIFSILLYGVGRREGKRSTLLCSTSFFIFCIASVLAGITHGFTLYLGPVFTDVVWKMTVILADLGGFMVCAAVLTAYAKRPWRNILLIVALVKYVLYVVWVATHSITTNDYHVVIYNQTFYAILFLFFVLYRAFVRKEGSAVWILLWVLINGIANMVQQSGFIFHKHFNYNDLYHLITIVGMFFIYKGAKSFRDEA